MESTQLYRKGENHQLDNEFARYSKMQLYRGNVMFEVLTDKEVKTLGKFSAKKSFYFQNSLYWSEKSRQPGAWKKEATRGSWEWWFRRYQKNIKNQKSAKKFQLAVTKESQGESHSVDSTLIY